MTEFRMPTLGADMEAGTLVEWLKQPGDPLSRGDIVAVVDTEKGAIEVEVFENGVLDRTLVAPGEKVPVGTVLAIIRGGAETPSTAAVAPAPAPAAGAGQRPLPAPAAAASSSHARATPGARKAAAELHVDVATVIGTGPAGAVTREDVERAATGGPPGAPAAPPEESRIPAPDRMAAMRSAIAAAMSRSKREIPHLYLSTTIDMTRAMAWLSSENASRSVEERVLPVALLLKAVAVSLAEVPGLNGFWRDGAFAPGTGVHVGCAIALRGGGLVAPAVHHADRKDLDTIMRDLLDLTARARRGTLRSSELADSTITVTSLGELGVDEAFAVIYPPQVAIVAFGRIAQRPWVVDGRIEPRAVLTASISADHRAVDGRRAGQYLTAVDRRLQAPDQL
jgi:pyruvate dehydrogenase E2 component (dihydrolipoamide acetyltransferase)